MVQVTNIVERDANNALQDKLVKTLDKGTSQWVNALDTIRLYPNKMQGLRDKLLCKFNKIDRLTRQRYDAAIDVLNQLNQTGKGYNL